MRQIFLSLLAVAMCIGCSAPSPKEQRLAQLKSQYDKFIALTFDDGPSSTTIGILDVLEQYDATATFFVMGQNVNESTRPIIERATSLGCEICNHSFSHPYMSQLFSQPRVLQSYRPTNAYGLCVLIISNGAAILGSQMFLVVLFHSGIL